MTPHDALIFAIAVLATIVGLLFIAIGVMTVAVLLVLVWWLRSLNRADERDRAIGDDALYRCNDLPMGA